jgi:hypothetical protein
LKTLQSLYLEANVTQSVNDPIHGIRRQLVSQDREEVTFLHLAPLGEPPNNVADLLFTREGFVRDATRRS